MLTATRTPPKARNLPRDRNNRRMIHSLESSVQPIRGFRCCPNNAESLAKITCVAWDPQVPGVPVSQVPLQTSSEAVGNPPASLHSRSRSAHGSSKIRRMRVLRPSSAVRRLLENGVLVLQGLTNVETHRGCGCSGIQSNIGSLSLWRNQVERFLRTCRGHSRASRSKGVPARPLIRRKHRYRYDIPGRAHYPTFSCFRWQRVCLG